MDKWFDNGFITKIPLKSIPSEFISFTYGDSMAVLGKSEHISIITKEMLSDTLKSYKGTIDSFMKDIVEKYYYIEVQLWNDDYCSYQQTN